MNRIRAVYGLAVGILAVLLLVFVVEGRIAIAAMAAVDAEGNLPGILLAEMGESYLLRTWLPLALVNSAGVFWGQRHRFVSLSVVGLNLLALAAPSVLLGEFFDPFVQLPALILVGLSVLVLARHRDIARPQTSRGTAGG
jgi:hypothetical protein